MTRSTRAGIETRRPVSSVNSRVTGPSSVAFGIDVHAEVIVRMNVQAKSSFNEVRDSTGPKHLSASVEKAKKRQGRSPGSENISHHSGATARDSHPLPYSPQTRGTQTLD